MKKFVFLLTIIISFPFLFRISFASDSINLNQQLTFTLQTFPYTGYGDYDTTNRITVTVPSNSKFDSLPVELENLGGLGVININVGDFNYLDKGDPLESIGSEMQAPYNAGEIFYGTQPYTITFNGFYLGLYPWGSGQLYDCSIDLMNGTVVFGYPSERTTYKCYTNAYPPCIVNQYCDFDQTFNFPPNTQFKIQRGGYWVGMSFANDYPYGQEFPTWTQYYDAHFALYKWDIQTDVSKSPQIIDLAPLINNYIAKKCLPSYPEQENCNIQLIFESNKAGILSVSSVVDKTPPVTTMNSNPSSPDGLHGCYVSKTMITLSCYDGESGCYKTYYRLPVTGSEPYTEYTGPIEMPEGIHTINYYSVDKAGNMEAEKSKTFYVDLTPPTTVITTSPNILWPPNKKMVDVNIGGRVNDNIGMGTYSFTVKD